MTEPANQLEAELSGMQPFPMPDELAHRIESELKIAHNPVSAWPDRFLLAAMASGAVAACVLVTILLADFAEPDHVIAPKDLVALSRYSHAPATPLAFANGNPEWIDVLK